MGIRPFLYGQFGRLPDPPEPQELSEQELIRSVLFDFYLTDHDFNIYVNKGCQTYDKTPEEMFDNAIVWEVYKEMQRGGCNEKRSNRATDPGSDDKAGSEATKTK